MKLAATRIAAAALATAAFAPRPASASDPLAGAEAGLAAAERHLAEVEALGSRPEEAPAARALRRFEAGRHQALLGDWSHAAILLSDAVDDPAFRGSPRRPEALFLLADALRRQGGCGEARPRYAELLALGAGERRADAVTGALECAVSDRRAGEVEALLAEAERAFGATPPPEVRYLAAKALFQRHDLAPEERRARAAAAFAQVGEPFQRQARYFQGVLEIERGNVRGSLRWFETCAGGEPKDPRQAEVRELCLLAVARVHAELGDVSAAIDGYAAIPWDSARLPEALYELAWAFVKGERYGQALRTAAFVVELGRDASLAPQATLLQGHLLLRLGRHAEATDAYNDVINAYAPVRDELDAILSLHEDPVRTFDEIVGRQGKAFDAAAVFPPVAVKWATTNRDLEVALGLVAALDRTRREVEASRDLAQRIQVLLARGGGLDAVPDLRRAFAGVEAVQTDAALLEGAAVGGASAAAASALPPGERRRLEGIREARLALEARVRALPRTLEAVDERLARVRGRVDRVDRSAFRMGILVEALVAAIDGIERWVEQHRSEIDSDREGRQQLAEELRQHRAVVAGYEQELRVVRQEIALARDAAAGAETMAEEAHLRDAYLQAVEAEAAAAASAPGALAPAGGGTLARVAAVRERLRTLRARADAARGGIAAEAARRAGELRDRIAAEQLALSSHAGALDGVQALAKALVGGIARDALVQVRAQFYRLVLEADVGIVDVAWSRKRQRLEKIQELAQQKASELERLDHDWRQLGREVAPP